MRHRYANRSGSKLLWSVLASSLLVLITLSLIRTAPIASAQGGAPDSTIALQMPFIAGETWTVGGDGSFYGDGAHTNVNNDYYATDWNRTNDNLAPVLPVADGIISAIQDRPCPDTSYGCYVQIDHTNGYRTLYGHLDDVLVAQGNSVHTWTLIGKVGSTGNSTGPHLHLTFRHYDNGAYYSHCWNNGQTCPNGEKPQAPQGYRPSPMMTTLGPTILEDGQAYTSVNGRIYLPDLRSDDTGVVTQLYVRNDGTETRTVKVYYYKADGMPTAYGSDTCGLNPRQRCWIPIYMNDRIPAGTTGLGFVDGGEAVAVNHMTSISGDGGMSHPGIPR